MSKFKVNYDENEDIMSIHKENSKSSGSIELGNLTFDFDNKNQIKGIEIMDALDFFSDIISSKVISEDLKNLENINIEIKRRDRELFVYLAFEIKEKEFKHTLLIPSTQSPIAALC